ncbi:GNAT family N-acetyltransferase [Roseicyclus persicicus]|uniref:GNAT family N-acetyltransferase n=1 Tax=Roseicyclus persicicus TaxID=2650661 RepID=A0A7X6GY82_9RHOB|nr:GNAT family protein [Roseibacterium persicicum]NKX43688.1 GNAT family N-acetyltransferase [Roseibacterium persicicum]
MLSRKRHLRLDTGRLSLRLPRHADFRAWTALREASREFLSPWEPTWAVDHLSRKSFTGRVYWAQRAVTQGTAVPLFIFARDDETLLGAITLDNIRRGPAQSATLGYWIGAPHARNGYMREAIEAVVHYAYRVQDLSRVEAACLPENAASRGVLEKTGFKYEGVAQSYLQINGRWRNHVLYAHLRHDRRGRTEIG